MGERPSISSYNDKWVASFRPMLSSGKHDTLVLLPRRGRHLILSSGECNMAKQTDFIEVGGDCYPRITIRWKDIVGDSAMVKPTDASKLVCPIMYTEGYLFDCFEEDGEKYVRTFATWAYDEEEKEASFGDRNCFPVCVLTKESRRSLKIALAWVEANKID